MGLAAPVAVAAVPPFAETHETVAPETGSPLFAGVLKETVRDPATALVVVGLAGAAGLPTTTAFDAPVAGPVPEPFVATTVHVYVPPVVTPATTIGVVFGPRCEADWVTPPSVEVHVAVYCVIVDP